MKILLFVVVLFASTRPLYAEEKPVEFSTFQLSDTVYMLKGRGGNVGVSDGEDGLFIIDDQVRPVTRELMRAVRKVSDKPIKFVVNTHYHYDHVGGNEAVGKAGAVIIAHDNIRKRMITEQVSIFMNETTPPYAKEALPLVTFNDRMSLHMNGETVTAYHVANGHTDGGSIIHFPFSNVIHMGDMFFNGLYPYVDLDAGGSIQGLVAAADLALSLADDATRIIPGHGPLGVTDDLRNYRDYLVQAIANVRELIDSGMTLEQVISAKPTKEWDEELGKIWITPAQFVTFIYNSLQGIHRYTPPETADTEVSQG